MPYHEVYQTWHMVRERRSAHGNAESTPAPPPVDLRFKAQTTRIENQLTVDDLARRIECTGETLAAFERGDEILSPEQLRRLRSVLGL